MSKLGGWLISTYTIEDDEELVVRYPANLFKATGRPLGGRLYLTDHRAIFLPHRIDSALGGTATVMPYDEIASVRLETKEERESGGKDMPNRVQIDMPDGTTYRFVVNNPEKVLKRLSMAIEPGGSPELETDQ